MSRTWNWNRTYVCFYHFQHGTSQQLAQHTRDASKAPIVRRPAAALVHDGSPTALSSQFPSSAPDRPHDDHEEEQPPRPSFAQSVQGHPIESLLRTATLNMRFLPRLRRRGTVKDHWDPARKKVESAVQWDLAKSIPLKDLIPLLSPVQRSFFEKLDMELDKVETFYLEREKEMRARYA